MKGSRLHLAVMKENFGNRCPFFREQMAGGPGSSWLGGICAAVMLHDICSVISPYNFFLGAKS